MRSVHGMQWMEFVHCVSRCQRTCRHRRKGSVRRARAEEATWAAAGVAVAREAACVAAAVDTGMVEAAATEAAAEAAVEEAAATEAAGWAMEM